MNEKLKWLTGSSFVGLIAVFAIYGKQLVEAFAAFLLFLGSLSSSLPGGLNSFFLSWAIAGLFYSFVRRWLTCQHGARREFLSQLFSLLVGIGITLGQQYIASAEDPGGPTAGVLFQAFLLGLIAGFGAPLAVQGLASLFAKPKPPAPPSA
ncbi:MAG: hypothetical protein ACREO0_15120 [Pseudoxanthomonas sp.]